MQSASTGMYETLRRSPVTKKTAVFLVSAAVTWTFVINFCALIYACGCQSLWAGAAEHCNIHMAESHHCPWCSIGTSGFNAVQYGIIAVQAVVSFGPYRSNILARLLFSL